MIEDLIYNAISQSNNIIDMLAKYNNNPAVFYKQVPQNTDQNWNDGIIYPHIVYNIDWQYNPETNSSGNLIINVLCTNENTAISDEIAKELENILSNLFLSNDKGTYFIVWNHSGNSGIGESLSVSFDILVFPNQSDIVPNPVQSINKFIKDRYKECIIIGYDKLQPIWKATDINPVVYVNLVSIKTMKTTYAMTWMESIIYLNIIDPEPINRQIWLEKIEYDLSVEGEVIMENGSPFLFMDIQFNSDSNTLYNNQITIKGQYGVLKKEKKENILYNTNFNRR